MQPSKCHANSPSVVKAIWFTKRCSMLLKAEEFEKKTSLIVGIAMARFETHTFAGSAPCKTVWFLYTWAVSHLWFTCWNVITLKVLWCDGMSWQGQTCYISYIFCIVDALFAMSISFEKQINFAPQTNQFRTTDISHVRESMFACIDGIYLVAYSVHEKLHEIMKRYCEDAVWSVFIMPVNVSSQLFFL